MRIEGEARLKVYAGSHPSPNPNPNPNANPNPNLNPNQVYAGSRGGRTEATGGHVFELQRLQLALKQVALCSLVITPSHVFELQRALKQVVAVGIYLFHLPASFLPYLLT